MELKTERLILRTAEKQDAEAIFRYRKDAETNKYQGWIPNSVEDVDTFLTKVSPEFNITGRWFQFIIIESNSTVIIGDIGVHFIDNKQVEIGCTLAKNKHGEGLATEALRSVVDHLFCKLNKHRVTASIDPRNLGSIRLVERLGFRKEAHFKESLFIDGEWVDDIIYAILKREWS